MERQSINVILLGGLSVGKTNLLNTSLGYEFQNDCLSTIGLDKFINKMKINDKEYKVILWDTSGQERFRAISTNSIRRSQIIILVFDVTNIKSLEELNYWMKTIEDYKGGHCVIGIIGNKMDLFEKMAVSEEEAKRFAEKYNCKLLLTSAKEDPKRFNQFIENLIIEYFDLYQEEEEDYIKCISLECEEKERKKVRGNCCQDEIYYSFPERFKARVFQWYVPKFDFKK